MKQAQVGNLALEPKGDTDEEFPSEVIHRLVGLKQLQVLSPTPTIF
jgi:hypothetical protein